MDAFDHDDTAHILKRLLYFGGDRLHEQHLWASEFDRWAEFVFAVLTQVSDLPHHDVRALTEQLKHLGLLSIDELTEKQKPGNADKLGTRISEIMIEAGMERDEATAGTEAIKSVAAALSDHFGGKLQVFLRQQSEQIVEHATKKLGLSILGKRQARFAITYWLQNACNLPLPLDHKSVKDFAKLNHISVNSIVETADAMDVSVNVLDQLIIESMELHARYDGTDINNVRRRAKPKART